MDRVNEGVISRFDGNRPHMGLSAAGLGELLHALEPVGGGRNGAWIHGGTIAGLSVTAMDPAPGHAEAVGRTMVVEQALGDMQYLVPGDPAPLQAIKHVSEIPV